MRHYLRVAAGWLAWLVVMWSSAQGAQPGSPADGRISKGGMIIGVGGKLFTDVKGDMAAAIDIEDGSYVAQS